MGKNPRSRANNSKLNNPIRPKFQPIWAFMSVLVTGKFDKDPIHRFSHYMSMGTFCCHGNHSFDPICSKTYPKDATDKIWLKSASWSWMYIYSKVWTTKTEPSSYVSLWLRWAKNLEGYIFGNHFKTKLIMGCISHFSEITEASSVHWLEMHYNHIPYIILHFSMFLNFLKCSLAV